MKGDALGVPQIHVGEQVLFPGRKLSNVCVKFKWLFRTTGSRDPRRRNGALKLVALDGVNGGRLRGYSCLCQRHLATEAPEASVAFGDVKVQPVCSSTVRNSIEDWIKYPVPMIWLMNPCP